MGKTIEELMAENEQLQTELIEFDEQSKQLEQELETELAKVSLQSSIPCIAKPQRWRW